MGVIDSGFLLFHRTSYTGRQMTEEMERRGGRGAKCIEFEIKLQHWVKI